MPNIPYNGPAPYLPDPIGTGGFYLYYVEPMSANCLKVWFSDHVVINDAYYNVNNYQATGLTINSVIKSTYTVCPFALLYINPQVEGAEYTLTVSNLKNRSGVTLTTNNTKSWLYNKTKLDSVLSNLPSMYDKRAISVIHRVMGAIANSDNTIGGFVTRGDE